MSGEYTLWSMVCPFRKNGTPVLGTMGSTLRNVIVMESETFKKLVADHPSLATAQFRVGTFNEDGT